MYGSSFNVAVLSIFICGFLFWRLYFGNYGQNSVVVLGLQYLARPNTAQSKYLSVTQDSAWNGSYMSANPHIWTDTLSESDKIHFSNSIKYFETLNKSMETMTKEDFPLPAVILNKFESWKYQLGPFGRGFQLIRGVPVNEWTMRQSEIFYWAFGKYLGIPGAQDIHGNLLGHVTDVGPTNQVERPYRTREDIDYHCDGADIVGLLCIHPAKQGGASRIISSVAVYNKLLGHPKGQQYVKRLFDRVMLFTRKTFGLAKYLPISPFRMDRHGVLRTYWNQEYYLKAYRHPNGTLTPFGESDPFAMEAIEAYDAILKQDEVHSEKTRRINERKRLLAEMRPDLVDSLISHRDDYDSDELGLDMTLQQGDIQLVSNHFILHARTEFEDYTTEEIMTATSATNPTNTTSNEASKDRLIPPIGKRDLLRLWVSTDNADLSWRLRVDKYVDWIRVMCGITEGMLFHR